MTEEVKSDKPEIIIYADGACSPNPGDGGYGIILICPEKNKRKEISGYISSNCTNNQAELISVIEALKALKKPCKIILVSDSQYVIHAHTQFWIEGWILNGWRNAQGKPVKNRELWEEMLELEKPHEIIWVWTRGHQINPTEIHAVENNCCDKLAQSAIANHKVD